MAAPSGTRSAIQDQHRAGPMTPATSILFIDGVLRHMLGDS